MNCVEKSESIEVIIQQLSLSSRKLEKLLMIHGLDEVATSWVMYAYVNGEKDDASYKRSLNAVFESVLFEFGVETHIADGIARIAIDEYFNGCEYSLRGRAAIMRISKTTFGRKDKYFTDMIHHAKGIVAGWEDALLVTAKLSGY